MHQQREVEKPYSVISCGYAHSKIMRGDLVVANYRGDDAHNEANSHCRMLNDAYSLGQQASEGKLVEAAENVLRSFSQFTNSESLAALRNALPKGSK